VNRVNEHAKILHLHLGLSRAWLWMSQWIGLEWKASSMRSWKRMPERWVHGQRTIQGCFLLFVFMI